MAKRVRRIIPKKIFGERFPLENWLSTLECTVVNAPISSAQRIVIPVNTNDVRLGMSVEEEVGGISEINLKDIIENLGGIIELTFPYVVPVMKGHSIRAYVGPWGIEIFKEEMPVKIIEIINKQHYTCYGGGISVQGVSAVYFAEDELLDIYRKLKAKK